MRGQVLCRASTLTDRQRACFAELPDRSPLLLVDLDVVRRRYLGLVEVLPGVTVFYAVKANPLPAVLRLLVELGSSFDVASLGEIEQCLAAGATPDRLSFGNTVKKASAIAAAPTPPGSGGSPSTVRASWTS